MKYGSSERKKIYIYIYRKERTNAVDVNVEGFEKQQGSEK